MDQKAAILPITFIKDIFHAERTGCMPLVDVMAFEGYGSPINMGRGHFGGRYSTEKVCIKTGFQEKTYYYQLEWIWAGGLYGSRFTGPSDRCEERFPKEINWRRLVTSQDNQREIEISDLFDAGQSGRHICALDAQKKDLNLILRFTYTEQQNLLQAIAIRTTIQCRMDNPEMIKIGDVRLNQSLSTDSR